MKTMTLPSGAKLEITDAPFLEARALYQAVAEELKGVKVNPQDEVDVNLFKDMFCLAISSKKIEAALSACMRRATYDGQRITDDTWEPVAARGDYLTACMEVASVNIQPFMKSLFAQYGDILAKLKLAEKVHA